METVITWDNAEKVNDDINVNAVLSGVVPIEYCVNATTNTKIKVDKINDSAEPNRESIRNEDVYKLQLISSWGSLAWNILKKV